VLAITGILTVLTPPATPIRSQPTLPPHTSLGYHPPARHAPGTRQVRANYVTGT
jgi:hypothetical protein